MAILGTLLSFFGCKKKSDYTLDDVVSLSVSCGEMDLTKCYSFAITLKDGSWIFYADCYSLDGETGIKLETPIKNEEAKSLLAEAAVSEFIASPKKFKKSVFSPRLPDETVYSSQITFSDGSEITTSTLLSRDIQNGFYALAEKYGKNA